MVWLHPASNLEVTSPVVEAQAWAQRLPECYAAVIPGEFSYMRRWLPWEF